MALSGGAELSSR